ncbi:tRNA-dihydrouridine synthase [Veillonella caviae]|uniref:oxidoreductase n=1 Tax=Veillonella caviae TaxID=248316 RepID=UPI000F8F4018|nr:NADH:flavin oxidoreductase [Veillonella caviae]
MTKITDALTVGPFTLKNRLVLPPMATSKGQNGFVTDDLCEYYAARSQAGIGLIITEHHFVLPNGQATLNQVSVSRDEDIPGLRKLAQAIHQDGSKAVLQINHAGSAAMPELALAGKAIGPSAIANANPYFQPRYPKGVDMAIPNEMTHEDIKTVVEAFRQAARRAKEAGFDGVEIHSAHGYLFSQFYSPLMNHRTDEYTGKTIEGRTKIQVETIKAIRQEVGPDFFISLRLGAIDDREGGSQASEAGEAAKIFEAAGINMISISGGANAYLRQGHTEEGFFQDVSRIVKEAVSIPVLLTGNIRTKARAEALLNDGACDLVGVGRPLLGDPQYVKELLD